MTDYLSSKERIQLEELRRRDSFVRETLEQVSRIVRSRRFERVQQRAKDFLGFVVAKTLLGQAEQIKETTIAISVFGESADFNPTETSKVRVAGADLRQRLGDYAGYEGQSDVIEILIPLNTYVPEIRDRRIAITIAEFENWHPNGEQSHLCDTITAEIVYRLDAAGLRPTTAGAVSTGPDRPMYTLRGSVENMSDVIRLNVSLADPVTGGILCSRSFEGPRDDVLKLARQVTVAVLQVLHALVGRAPAPRPSRKQA